MNQSPSHGHTQRSQFTWSCAGLGLVLSFFSIVLWCHSAILCLNLHSCDVHCRPGDDDMYLFSFFFCRIIHWFRRFRHILFFYFLVITPLEKSEKKNTNSIQIYVLLIVLPAWKINLIIWNVNCTNEEKKHQRMKLS